SRIVGLKDWLLARRHSPSDLGFCSVAEWDVEDFSGDGLANHQSQAVSTEHRSAHPRPGTPGPIVLPFQGVAGPVPLKLTLLALFSVAVPLLLLKANPPSTIETVFESR